MNAQQHNGAEPGLVDIDELALEIEHNTLSMDHAEPSGEGVSGGGLASAGSLGSADKTGTAGGLGAGMTGHVSRSREPELLGHEGRAERTESVAVIQREGTKAGSVVDKGGLVANAEQGNREPGSVYRTRGLVWCAIAIGWICCAASVLLRGGAVEWFLGSVLSAVIIVSGIAPALAAAGLTVTRLLPRNITQDGKDAEVRITLKRSFVIPFVWIAVCDETANESSAAANRISFRTVFFPLLQKETMIPYTLRRLRRGRHQFGDVSVTIGDWLGLTAIHKRLVYPSELVVLPGLPQAEFIDYTERSGGYGGQMNRSLTAGAGIDYRGDAGREEIAAAVRAAGIGPETRPYREGDSLRHVDFRNAAKGRGLQTKVYTREQPVQTLIAVDTVASAYDRDDRLFDACIGWASHAVQQAEALGSDVTLLAGQQSIGAQSNDMEQGQLLRTSLDGDISIRLSDMLQMMALLRPEERGSLAASFVNGQGLITRGGTVLVFTADWRGGRSWGELAGFAAEKGCRMELFIVTRNTVPSFAMREQQKWLESGGVKVTWLHVPTHKNVLPYAEEGGDEHDYA